MLGDKGKNPLLRFLLGIGALTSIFNRTLTARKDEYFLRNQVTNNNMKKVTNKADFNKHIECLKAWREFAMNGVVKNVAESDKITLEMAEFKDNHRYLFN